MAMSTSSDLDVEKAINLPDFPGAPSLTRQISMQLTPEEYERLFLQPGGVAAKGGLSSRLGNPTPFGVASFVLCLTPLAADLMGWNRVTTDGLLPIVGAFYWCGGLGMLLSGLLEFIVGNTFPSVVFMSYGAFWLSFAHFLDPTQQIAEALGGATNPDYNNGLAHFFSWFALLTFIFLIASLRTNVVFVLLFTFLDVTFALLAALRFRLADANVEHLGTWLKVSGAFAFLTSAMGWYLLVVLLFGSTGIPLALPIGDLSGFLSGKRKET